MFRLIAVLSVLLGVVAMPRDAHAELNICNETDGRRSFAIAYKDRTKNIWRSEGWWNVESGACKTVVKGDLKQRYYYYRAMEKGKGRNVGKYRFCLTNEVFTIEGEKDCKARGYDSALFSVIDTGKKAKSFKFTLTSGENKADDEKETAKAPVAKPENALPFERGSLGEPYTVTGILQGCDTNEEGRSYCAYHSEGWKHYAYADGGTPASIMADLERIGPGTRIEFVGDMITYGDITTEVAIAKYDFANDDKFKWYREQMQGYWNSAEDDAYYIHIDGSEKKDFYDANLSSHEFLQWADTCATSRGQGPVLIATNPEDRENPLCYFIVSITDYELVLNYTEGNGQDLAFIRQN